jgi:hypothetical protein
VSAKHKKRRWVLLTLGVGLALTFVGGVVGARLDVLGDPEKLDVAIQREPLVRIADIGAAEGLSGRGVFAQETSTGHLCLWDSPSTVALTRQGGCNSAGDPLGGKEFFISFAYDGGPAIADVKDARLIGLADVVVAEIDVAMNDGSRRDVKLKKAKIGLSEYRAFGYRFKKADLRRGIAPVAVVALDQTGQEIDRQPTGFGG